MDIDPYTLLKAVLVPPGACAAVGLLGILAYRSAPRLGVFLLGLAAVSMWVLGMPATAMLLAERLENAPPLALEDIKDRGVGAIVILGGGLYRLGPEFERVSEASYLTLERLRHGARLHRATGIDIAVTGGAPHGSPVSEAEVMRTSLKTDFRVPVRWLEGESRNTAENAEFCRRAFPFDSIVLVTHAMHMPRAKRAFEGVGYEVMPAPLGYVSGRGAGFILSDFLPSGDGFLGSRYAIYEYFAALWYHWNYE